MLRAALAAALLFVSACSKDQGGPGSPDGGGKMCTEIGCVDGLRVALNKAGAWQPGAYTFAFELDGAPVRCSGALPLKPCGEPSLTCDVEGRVGVGESGCALPPEQHGFSDIQLQSSPAKVRVTITRDGQELANAELAPTYTESRPNGPGCEPVCRGASAEVAVQ